jgi:hypothetical protein
MIYLTRLSATCTNMNYILVNIPVSVSELISHLSDGGWSGIRASKLAVLAKNL